jgi:hypothetical protein
MVMRSGTARLLLAACSTLTLVACGSVAGQHARTGSAATRAQASAHGTPGATAPLLAYQTASGRLAWRAGMPTFVQSPPVLVPDGILVQPADPVYACATTG